MKFWRKKLVAMVGYIRVSTRRQEEVGHKELGKYLQNNPGLAEMKLKDLVRSLNEVGLLNLVSERQNIRKPWTTRSLRKPLTRARRELTEQELQVDDFDVALGFDQVFLHSKQP